MVRVGDSRLVKPCGRVILPVRFGGSETISHMFYILDGLPYDVVLGTGYLKQTGALMNYADGWISFPQKGAQLELQRYTDPITFKRDKASYSAQTILS